MYAISFEISAFLLSVLCIVYCLTAKRRQYIPPKGIGTRMSDQHFQFLMMLASIAISAIASVTGVYLTSLSGEGVRFWQYLFHAFYFIFHTTLSLAFGLYIVSVTGTNIKKHKVLYALFYLPYFVAEGLILTNQWTNWCFYMDDASVYHRGPLMIVLYGLAAFYIAMGLVFFLKNMRAITKVDRLAVGVFILLATAGIIVQAVRSDWLVELFFESLACLVIMMVLEEKAGHVDQVTGLLNRFAFTDHARRKMANKQSFGLVIVKIAGIGGLTKRFGERTADEFLLQFARFLSSHGGGGTSYGYRRGEFLTLFPNTGEDAETFAQKVLERLRSTWTLGTIPMSMDGVAAIVRAPEDVHDFDELEDLLVAFTAYQKTKDGPYLIPQEQLRTMILSRLYEEELRKVVAKKQLEVYFQPIYSLTQQRTVSAEALLRINVEPFTHVSPEAYVPIAEKTGLIHEIGLYVFEEVCRYLAAQKDDSCPIRYIELNLSPYQFLDKDLVEDFESIRKKYGVDSSKINLEITETGGALDKEEILKALDRFVDLGYTLSLDDFGTGYSNFVRMVRCHFENIKIDKSILWTLGDQEKGLETLKSLASFIKLQGSCIVQEGVENKNQLDLVGEYGCDYVQGFYFSKALPRQEFEDYLAHEGR